MHSERLLRSDPHRIQKPTHPKHSQRIAKTSAIQTVNRLPSPQSDSPKRSETRERNTNTDDPAQIETPRKKRRLQDARTASSSPDANAGDNQNGAAVDWKEYFGQWPPEQRIRMSQPRANKRSRSRSSYTQSVREGSSPTQWTRRHAEEMQEAGLIMGDYKHLTVVTDDSKQLCKDLLEKKYPIPKDSSFQVDQLTQVLDRVQFRNEARVVRDITPILVPSPERLYFSGRDELAHIYETLDAVWTQCDLLGGPRPKPDLAIGISPSAFSTEEKEKLKLSNTSACPNFFPENMYFPFLVCEVKQSDRPIEEAERQAMHSASIAVRAVIQLYKKTSLISEVDQKILVFSVAHNHSTVKIFGHFAKLDGDKITFFRHRLFSGEFAAELSSGNWTSAYQITRAIYEIFYPKHLARIKDALSQMRDPTLASFTSHLELDVDSQDLMPSSQEDEPFKKPSLSSSMIKLRQENEKLRDQLIEVLREQKEQMAQQKDESQEQKAMMEQQLAQQKEQMERQLDQQKEESRDQKEQMERQVAQQDEIIKLLRGTRSEGSSKE